MTSTLNSKIFGILLAIYFSKITFAIDIFTEEFPPFSFTDQEKIVGVSTEIVKEVLKTVGIDYRIYSYPWARTYNKVQENCQCLIYSIGRNSKREKLFKWIGVIVPTKQVIYALKKRTDIKYLEFNELKKYKIGTTINDFRENYLISKGFDIKKLLRTGGEESYLVNYKHLKKGNIDLWPMIDVIAKYIVVKQGDNPDQILKNVHNLIKESKSSYYLAASLATSDKVVKKLRLALKKLKNTERYQYILNKWNIKTN